jgi:hypothetical protein
MENEVKSLVEQGKDMAGLSLFSQQVAKIIEVHEALANFYSMIWNGSAVLKHFGSERLRQLGHELKPIEKLLREDDYFLAEERKIPGSIENLVKHELSELGFKRKHWWISGRLLAEIEYMIDTLKILIEPEFIPFADSVDGQEQRPDRYVSAEVKLAVWRRDCGKCVECGSKEKLEYDHIIPVNKGGSNTERNIQLLCEKCNRKKAALIQ